jgi:hypothetical protein
LKPCFLVKLNKIFDFIPTPYEADDEKDLPQDIPQKVLKTRAAICSVIELGVSILSGEN